MVNRKFLFWLLALGVLLLDQLTKWIITTTMEIGQNILLIRNFFSISYVHNTGAGFGILQNQNSFLILIALIAITIIMFLLRKILKEHHTTIAASLILGGAAGNLVDRLVYGGVIDFINFSFWPAFNVADSALTVGVIWLVWMSFIEKK